MAARDFSATYVGICGDEQHKKRRRLAQVYASRASGKAYFDRCMPSEPRQPSQQSGLTTKRMDVTLLKPTAAVLLYNLQQHGTLLQRLGHGKQPTPQMDPGAPEVAEGRTGLQARSRTPQHILGGASMKVDAEEGTMDNRFDTSPCPGTLADYITAIQARGGRIRWRPEDVKAMLMHLASLPPGSSGVDTKQAMEKLGIAHLPDPDNKLCVCVTFKLHTIRNTLAHGRDPLAGEAMPRARPGTYNFRGWLKQALLTLPNCEGTLAQAAAILEADPDISPKLDRRPDHHYHSFPVWRTHLKRAASWCPEFVNTGRKQGKGAIYRYDEGVAQALQEGRKPPKAPKGRVPHLGARGGCN
ncbi:hypothetical protein Agub_g7494 [Astrephomene gubernaculifera]|uniref:Uncharacterized protein n=1 Tax=Astrephomene gubernaculifera TaxID=47775 RepID=A0AAD3DQ80_9CHLO|nr:hypothetical protein Agub_g7494 [Astrephomene gubernaculifera]